MEISDDKMGFEDGDVITWKAQVPDDTLIGIKGSGFIEGHVESIVKNFSNQVAAEFRESLYRRMENLESETIT